MSSTNRVYGIDLGTTYSCIAYVDESGKATVVANSEGQSTTPSVVYFEEPGKTVVGRTAKDVAVLYPDRVVSAVKRSMGDPEWLYEADGVRYQPQDVSSFILRKLVNDAQVATGDTITDVVITCPAYFGVTQKEATRQAGTLAGLNVRYVIPEPTAAALAYGMEQTEDQVILVFDLGGGTFDITVLEVRSDAINVVCTGGDHDLGGKNWDETIATWFADEFSVQTGVPAESLKGDPETWQELMNAAENAKISLSAREKFPQRVRFGADSATIELTRAKFDELTESLLQKTLSLTEALLATAAEKGFARIDHLLLVGGSTFMPQVQESVKARFPFDIRQFDPNQAVAKGAALFGFKCVLDQELARRIGEMTGRDAGEVDVDSVRPEVRAQAEQDVAVSFGLPPTSVQALTKKTIRNVTSKSFGIVVKDRATGEPRVNNLIVFNQSVPCSVARRFGTADEGQEGVMLRCMENLDPSGPDDPPMRLDSSTELGTAELRFTRALPQGSPVEISFHLAADGLLTVHGKDLTTNQEITPSFKTAAIMSVEEVEANRERNMGISVS